MAKKTGKVISMEGEIRNGAAETDWILYRGRAPRANHYDIVHAAFGMGYELGDRIKYKIIIEPKPSRRR